MKLLSNFVTADGQNHELGFGEGEYWVRTPGTSRGHLWHSLAGAPVIDIGRPVTLNWSTGGSRVTKAVTSVARNQTTIIERLKALF